MKTTTLLSAATSLGALLAQALPLGPRQAAGDAVTVTLHAAYGRAGPAAKTLTLQTPGTTTFARPEGYAEICARTSRDRACTAFALLDGEPNIDRNHPAAGARARPLAIVDNAPAGNYEVCVSQRGRTEFPDGRVEDTAWAVRGVRLECPGRTAAAALAARAPPAPTSTERLGNTFFVHYEG